MITKPRALIATALILPTVAILVLAAVQLQAGGTSTFAEDGDDHGSSLPPVDGLTSLLNSEASILLHKMQLVLGEVPCGEGCVEQKDFHDVIAGLIERCVRLEPGALRAASMYEESVHGEVLQAVGDACMGLISAAERFGSPSQTAGWQQAVTNAKTILAEGLE